MKIYSKLVFLFAIIIIQSNITYAKRGVPKEVPPLIYNDIKYIADWDQVEMGYIEARDRNTDELIWKKQVYKVFYNPTIETDVQDVYINEIKIENNLLLVKNEAGKTFKLDPKTGKSISWLSTKYLQITEYFIIILFLIILLYKKRASKTQHLYK